MSETVCLNLSDLESDKYAVIDFYKRQIEAFRYMKKEIERVPWADAKYDQLVDAMNAIGYALSEAIQRISNGSEVYAISDLIPLANEYLSIASKFPRGL